MAIQLTPAFDPTCRAIAETLTNEAIVNQILDFDGFASGQGLGFPLLQVTRMSGEGELLETTEIRIEYFLQDPNAVYSNPGIFRFVEVAIAGFLRDLHFEGLADEVKIITSSLEMNRGFLSLKEVGIFPYTRLTCRIQESDHRVS
jgi:hypothetical protein